MNREDIRAFEKAAKDKNNLKNLLQNYEARIYNNLRKEFNKAYHDELDDSIQNFLIAIAYTLHYSEELNLKNDELNSFMEDLFVSVDLFRKGEYKPEDYIKQLEEDGIRFQPYDYSKIYREHTDKIEKELLPYKERNEKAIKGLEDFYANTNQTSCNLGDLQLLQDILEGNL